MENEYQNLFVTGNYTDLIKIIKATYSRNKEIFDSKRKKGDKNEFYFKKAEKYLYNEFGLVLGIDLNHKIYNKD